MQRFWRSARARNRRRGLSPAGRWAGDLAPAIAIALLSGESACAADATSLLSLKEPTAADISWLVILLLLMFSVLTASLHLIGRRRWTRRESELASSLARTRAALDRANLFLASEPQILIAWDQPGGEPRIEGDFSLVADAPSVRRVLAFGAWLEPGLAATMEKAVERLLERGEAFSLAAASLKGRHFEIDGRAVAGCAVMRIRDISGERLQLASLRESHGAANGALASLRALLDAMLDPAWTRDLAGRINWTNLAYARAVEAADAADAVARGLELLNSNLSSEAAETRAKSGVWRRRAPAVVAGGRKLFEAVEVATEIGAAGVAHDLSELESVRSEMERHSGAYSRMLDQLSTAVAIFDRAKKLTFYNASYRQIWTLDPVFLDSQPSDGEVLDRLRSMRQLPEQADFRSWKTQVLSAYQAIEPIETIWHLPDGRTLRVVASPNPQGGVTYLFDDATQSYALASQVNALTRVQGETLDALKEGVAVFGADGRIKLNNPAFTAMWRLEAEDLTDRPHIDAVARHCAPLLADTLLWDGLRATIVDLPEVRRGYELRVERTDGLALDCAALPLPDGATLLTFLDVTASANVERALTERNQALVSAEKLRNDFVNHVSYELRTPLTNIIGFTQLLADGGVGPLNPKQLEYAGFITKSSAALLAIINDILDLASIDAGALEIRPESVDIVEAMKAAAEGVQDRLSNSKIELRIVATDDVGALKADGRRIRQVLFNLLSNAIGFSAPGQTVTLAAMRRGDEIVFKVSDRGRGIPNEVLDRVFDRFESHTGGSRHRGPGLGLSIVRALVELHGGRVTINSVYGEGTTVTCVFPIEGAPATASAAA